MIAVSDTSPMTSLIAIQRIDILHDLSLIEPNGFGGGISVCRI